MNCRSFQENVFEYLDDGLSRRAQAAAKRHIEQCADCRQSVAEFRKTTEALSSRFHLETESLTLSRNLQTRIIAAAEKKSASRAAIPFITDLWRPIAWLGTGVAFILVSAVLVTGPRWRHKQAAQSLGDESDLAISLKISYCDPIYTFSTDGKFVIDTLNCQPRIVEESIRLSNTQIRHQQETKSPL